MILKYPQLSKRLISNLPTFIPSINPKKRPIDFHSTNINLFDVSLDSFYDAFRNYDVRLSWQIYNELEKTNQLQNLLPDDHTRLLHMLTIHTHPPIAAAHASRIHYQMKKLSIPLDPRDYHSLLKIHLINRDLRRLLRIYESMLEFYPPDVISTGYVLSAYTEFKDLKGVTETWSVLKNIPGALDNMYVWSLGILGFGTSGKFHYAEKLFHDFCKLNNNDARPYESMIVVWGVMGSFKKAKSVFLEMKEKCDLDLASFDAIIEACELCNQFDSALEYWDELLVFCTKKVKCGDKMLPPPQIPLLGTINRMLGFYSRQKNIQKVLELHELLRKAYLPNVQSLEHIIWTFIWVDQEQNAITWYDEMIERGYMPSVLLVNTIVHLKRMHETPVFREMDEELKLD